MLALIYGFNSVDPYSDTPARSLIASVVRREVPHLKQCNTLNNHIPIPWHFCPFLKNQWHYLRACTAGTNISTGCGNLQTETGGDGEHLEPHQATTMWHHPKASPFLHFLFGDTDILWLASFYPWIISILIFDQCEFKPSDWKSCQSWLKSPFIRLKLTAGLPIN